MNPGFSSALCLFVLVAFLSSCGSDSVFEAKKDFEGNYWLKSEPVVFDFRIEDASVGYEFQYFVRNTLEYPYQNIYLQYYLEDSLGNVLSKKLNNVVLFYPKTGKPVGSGVGDTYDLQKTFLDDFQFPRAGTYRLRIDQYMRQDTLRHIHTIGLIIDQQKED